MIWNTHQVWGWPARAFHWIIALMILVQFSLGIWMEEFVVRADRDDYKSVHASLGISILALMVLRLGWRMNNVVPLPPAATPNWQRRIARGVHWALYLVTFATVLVGWMLAGSEDTPIPIKMFGFIDMPQLVSPGSQQEELLEEVHGSLAFTLIALVIVHTGAAYYHMKVLRDDVMRRMVSGTSRT